MKLALDNHFSPKLAKLLRAQEHDVVAAIERGWDRKRDEDLLALCREERRALLTNDVGDFVRIVAGWAAERRHHSGLIFTSDASRPRDLDAIGGYIRSLAPLMLSLPADDALVDQVVWL